MIESINIENHVAEELTRLHQEIHRLRREYLNASNDAAIMAGKLNRLCAAAAEVVQAWGREDDSITPAIAELERRLKE